MSCIQVLKNIIIAFFNSNYVFLGHKLTFFFLKFNFEKVLKYKIIK